jgi:hypothetical protein
MESFKELTRVLSESAKQGNRKPKQTYDFLKMLPDIDEDMSNLQPFVFTSTKELAQHVPKADDDILACPFELFSIELEDIALTCTEVNDAQDMGVNILSIICKELSPSRYKFWMYNKIEYANGETAYLTVKAYEGGYSANGHESSDTAMYDSCMDIVTTYLDRLHKEHLGTFNASGRAKIRVNGKKGVYRPKSVIYVTKNGGKKYRSSVKAQGTKTINWDHTWTVTNHWRKLENPESFGKNRMGEREEKGYTFISSYSKGEGLEIRKIRRVTF